eukprot:11415068-Ditylum_brightwellii.AAC.1
MERKQTSLEFYLFSRIQTPGTTGPTITILQIRVVMEDDKTRTIPAKGSHQEYIIACHVE